MTTHGEGSFQIASWDENPYLEIDDARKLTRAEVTQTFAGDIEGEGAVTWLMCYRSDGTADWIGLQRIVGQVGGRSGSFVLTTVGTFDGSRAAGDWSIVAGSGTDELEGLRGKGRMQAPMGGNATYTLEYDV